MIARDVDGGGDNDEDDGEDGENEHHRLQGAEL